MDSFKATGMVNFKHYNAEGELINEFDVKNLVVTTGLYHIAGRMSDTGTPTQMSHMAIGSSDASAPALSDTALGAQLDRVSLNTVGGVPSNATVTYAATFAPHTGGTWTVKEAGIFNANSSGTMLCRTTFPVINKAVGDTLAVSWVITIS